VEEEEEDNGGAAAAPAAAAAAAAAALLEPLLLRRDGVCGARGGCGGPAAVVRSRKGGRGDGDAAAPCAGSRAARPRGGGDSAKRCMRAGAGRKGREESVNR